MSTHRFGLVFSLTVLSAAAASGSDVVYQNDFSTRTSVKPIAPGEWYEKGYSAFRGLARTYKNADYTPTIPYEDQGAFQDSWVKALSKITGTQPTWTVEEEDTGVKDRFVAVNSTACESAENATAVVLTPFYNDFTTGVVRISCDLRYGDGLLANTKSNIRIRPLYKAFLNPDPSPLESKICPTSFGFQYDSAGKTIQASLVAANNGEDGNTRAVYAGGPNVTDEQLVMKDKHWYRFTVDLDLDEGRAGGFVYDLGTAHPTFECEGTYNGTFFKTDEQGQVTNEGRSFYYKMTPERGPLSGVALNVSQVSTSTFHKIKASPAFDNLSVAWKAPGSTDFVSVYENDFTKRRYRTACPAGTEAANYGAFLAKPFMDEFSYSHTNVWKGTTAETKLLLADITTKEPQPVGYDAWRRIAAGSKLTLAVVDWSKNSSGDKIDAEKGGRVLRVSSTVADGNLEGNTYVWAVTPLGESITAGKVRMTADVHLPNVWVNRATRSDVALVLADDAAYTSKETLTSAFALRGGISGGSKSDDTRKSWRFSPCCNTDDGYRMDVGKQLTSNTWYRIELTADMDNKTTGGTMKIWKIGESSVSIDWKPTKDPVYTYTDIPFRKNGTANISTIGFYVSNTGDDQSKKTVIAIDNIRVAKNVGTADEKEIYTNTFTTRTRSLDAPKSVGLIGTINNDNGVDYWIRRSTGLGQVRVVGRNDNPCAASWMSGTSGSYAVHPFVKRVRVGTIRVDMRPPSVWSSHKDVKNRLASVVVGGDDFAQGGPKQGSSSFATAFSAMTFGFRNTTEDVDQQGWCTGSKLYVTDGDGDSGGTQKEMAGQPTNLDPTHWYRFCADFNSKRSANEWSLSVYDMGTAHPEIATPIPDGALVATETGLHFRKNTFDGLSAFCFNAQGNSVSRPDESDDPGMALYDNVVVTDERTGAAIILR